MHKFNSSYNFQLWGQYRTFEKNLYLLGKYKPALFSSIFKFLAHLKRVRFNTKDGEEVYFDENGDVVAKYEIINWQANKESKSEFTTVGHYDSSFPGQDRLIINIANIVWANNATKVSKRQNKLHSGFSK